MNQLHVVTGAGPVGWTVAEQLAERGHRVRVLTRSGSGPDHPSIEKRRVDIETDDLRGHFENATAIYHCTHVAYEDKVWRAKLPTMERRVLDAAAGTVVVFPESLYSYGYIDGPIREDSPRVATHRKLGVRTELLAARDAHATPTVSVAASDFYGPRVLSAHMGDRVVPKVLSHSTVRVIADADLPHSFTYVPDFAVAMIEAAATPSLWNTFLHAPTAPAVTQRQMIEAFARAAHAPTPKVGTIPSWMMKSLGVVSGPIKELGDTLYQFEHPYVLDSSASEKMLGLRPTPLSDGAAATVAWWKDKELAQAS
ncbi:NAD-dependent epimerase/dehydratase family protein [Rhodococcus sp. BP-252]|uniref:Epimerase n=1 Tax=Rhodococcoides kyotonense TaxID=398843 RepID=A0A177Y946_9NOCA|nr:MULTISPECIES: NAD-dependent epimerase/dehydratase family protein [Rhodococcus]MBY6411949.1 NAD-dependent epimerase/dehydratase family protein [Rhodococcus sp. BP-320]MBY6416423.1 NAD-dependent epimerase/dehydratase family protein [Rhodococcus sp. BP-321]MBY6420771.1 NAD-dependent epimerase/dehydratase family protein [Rhodococcus sp. BP-324]MBY6426447.1 NAD-dependent epimerase/dehydratase family protein [Rhodococcus sp. BP-323]MBY6431446.1 NAD-dependent epimerase/dehydratase family protein [